MAHARIPLRPETRAAFLVALEGLRAAGATIVFDDSILPDDFAQIVGRVGTMPYIREGTEKFLVAYGPADYHSPAEYARAVGSPLASHHHRWSRLKRGHRRASSESADRPGSYRR